MINKINFVSFLTLFLLGIQLQSQNTKLNLDSLLQTHIDSSGFPAIAVGIITTDTVIYRVKGNKRFDIKDPVQLRSKFHLGSNTKAITAFIAMKLVEEERLSMDVKLTSIFPELKDKIHQAYMDISLADLFKHKAFVKPYTDFDEFESLPRMSGDIVEDRKLFMEYVLREEPVAEGTYSNAGLVIASHILEEVTGQSFEILLDSTMKALHLDYCIGFPNRMDSLAAWGHYKENDSILVLGPDHEYTLPEFLLPAGDVAMDIINYSKFIEMHFNGLRGQDNYLSADSYAYLHYGKSLGKEPPDGKATMANFGWGFVMRDGIKITAHSGSAGTYNCKTILIPERNIAIIVMTNSAEDYQEKIVSDIRNKLMQAYQTKENKSISSDN